MAEPIRLKHSNYAEEWANSPERIDVFTVTRDVPNEHDDGTHEEEHTYTAPAKPHAGLGLEYLRQARRNEGYAGAWLVETAIGSDAYTVLVDELAGLESGEADRVLGGIIERIQKIVLGGLEAPKG
jgi:hypothetical protein